MESLRNKLIATYFSFDTRSLALFRIALAVTLWVDLSLRCRVLDAFYTNEGILPNHTLLWSPTQPPAHLNQNQFFSGYSQFAQQSQFRSYSTAFEEWIMQYPSRVARGSTEIPAGRCSRTPRPGHRAAGQERDDRRTLLALCGARSE
jgi:hypothetical protein